MDAKPLTAGLGLYSRSSEERLCPIQNKIQSWTWTLPSLQWFLACPTILPVTSTSSTWNPQCCSSCFPVFWCSGVPFNVCWFPFCWQTERIAFAPLFVSAGFLTRPLPRRSSFSGALLYFQSPPLPGRVYQSALGQELWHFWARLQTPVLAPWVLVQRSNDS